MAENDLRPIGSEFDTEGMEGITTDGRIYWSGYGYYVRTWRVIGHSETVSGPAETVELVKFVRYPPAGYAYVPVPIGMHADGSLVTQIRALPLLGEPIPDPGI